MITNETHIQGFDARSWHRLVTMVAPGLASRAPHEFDARAAEEGGTLFVLYHERHVLRAVHSHRGVVDVGAWLGRDGLSAMAQAQGARFAVAAESGALEELYERLGGRLRPDDDLFTTALVAVGALRELHDEGEFHVWPQLLAGGVPLPTPAVLRRALNFALPEGRAALLALFDRDAIDTAVIVSRRDGAIEQVLGPEALRDIVGPLGGDFRRDHRVIRAAVEREVGPLAFGLVSETSTIHELLRDTTPGAWARAVAVRDVVFDPLPAWLAVAIGAGAARAVAARSRGLLAGLNVNVLAALHPAVERLRAITETVSGLDIQRVFGFNPMDVLAQVLGRSSPSGSRPKDERVP